MARIGRRAYLRPGCEAEYERWHRQVWPSVLQASAAAGIRNYSIYRAGNVLFSYWEVEDLNAAVALLAASSDCQRWQELMAPFMQAADPLAPWEPMDEVFHLD